MSGLIWAGIGKGIADAGQTFGNAMMRDYEMRQQEARELARDERTAKRDEERDRRLLERQEALDELKAARARASEEELQQRVIKESAQVGTRAGEIATAREGKAFDKLAESSALAGEQGDFAVSKEQLQKLAKDTPSLGAQYRSMGLIDASMPLTKNEQRLQRAEDEIQASLDIGAHSSVQNAMLKKRESVLNEIRLENTERKNDQQHQATLAAIAERGRQWDEKKPILQQNADASTTRADASTTRAGAAVTSAGAAATRAGAAVTSSNAAMIRANKSPAGGSGGAVKSMPEVKLNQEAETLRKAAKDASSADARRDYEARLKEVMDEIARRRSGGAAPAPQSGNNPKPAATISSLPKGAVQIGTSGGKPVYQTPDGKRFIGN